LLTVGSFAFALWLTDAFAPWAFYSLPSRLWELALGGLLAVAAGWLARLPGLVRCRSAGWASVWWRPVSPGSTAHALSGSAALLPTLGAAALIVAGRGRGPIG
jgi:peptidoglycan/LPS O-acetylase OafA/YrhL